MFNRKTFLILLIIFIVGIPFVFREKTASVIPIEGKDTVIIITAHNESSRREFANGFKKWYKAKTGNDVNIDWRYQGGGRDAARYIESTFANNFRLYWTENLKRPWNVHVATAFTNRSEKLLGCNNSLEAEITSLFMQSDVGCGADILFGGGVFEFETQASKGNLLSCDILSEFPEMFTHDTIPETLSGNRLWDAQGRWFGTALSAFGIIYNSDAILEDGIGFFPKTWMDIGQPQFFKKLAIVDPTKSSSTQKAFVMLVQQQMQICYDELKKELNLETLSSEDEHVAISRGWTNALKLIQKIVANGRYFTESATRPVIDVSSGNCLAGIAVDFYGFAEAKHLEERSGSKRFKFVMPQAGGAPSPDPIGIFRGAPNQKLAKNFIEYILSIEGQKLMDFQLNTPGGPEITTMRRVPILKTIYAPQYERYRCDPTINPYKAAAEFVSHEDWTNKIFNAIGFVIKTAFIDLSDELSEAMKAIILARQENRIQAANDAYVVLSDMTNLSFENVLTDIVPILSKKNPLDIIELQKKIEKIYIKQYISAKKIAKGLVPSRIPTNEKPISAIHW